MAATVAPCWEAPVAVGERQEGSSLVLARRPGGGVRWLRLVLAPAALLAGGFAGCWLLRPSTAVGPPGSRALGEALSLLWRPGPRGEAGGEAAELADRAHLRSLGRSAVWPEDVGKSAGDRGRSLTKRRRRRRRRLRTAELPRLLDDKVGDDKAAPTPAPASPFQPFDPSQLGLGPQLSAKEVPTDSAAVGNIVGEGEECNGSLPPEVAKICQDGLECTPKDKGLKGGPGTCTKASDDSSTATPMTTSVQASDNSATATPTTTSVQASDNSSTATPMTTSVQVVTGNTDAGIVVGAGEECNPDLPPEVATICQDGFECVTNTQGAPGTCNKVVTGNADAGIVVGAGEECNPDLPPEVAKVCQDGLECVIKTQGAPGTCIKAGADTGTVTSTTPPVEASSSPSTGTSTTTTLQVTTEASTPPPEEDKPVVVKEGEECNDSLPPQYATVCADGFECFRTKSGMGAPGTCEKKSEATTEASTPPPEPDKPVVVKEGEECNDSLPPQFATVCADGFECFRTKSGMGAPGTCKKNSEATTEASTPAPDEEKPVVVKEGEECNASLPPRFATVCADGFECVRTKPGMGAPGTCKKKSEADEKPVVVKEGEECNDSLPPRFAILCADGFECLRDKQLMGAPGTCTKKGDERPRTVAEGEVCNDSLPPRFATVCADGYECVRDKVGTGAPGTCRKESEAGAPTPVVKDAGRDKPTVVGEGKTCNGSLPPRYATVCADGLQCLRRKEFPGSPGICTKGDEVPTGPKHVGEGERCNGSLPPQFAILCQDGLTCIADKNMVGAFGVCGKARVEPKRVGEGDKCNGSLPPEFATICQDGLQCVRDTRMVGSSGVCKKQAKCDVSCRFEGETYSCRSRVSWARDNMAPKTLEGALAIVNGQCTGQCSCSAEDFSAKAPSPPGGHLCCKALIATCLACEAGVDVAAYCKDHPNTTGCPEGGLPEPTPTPLVGTTQGPTETPSPHLCSAPPNRTQVLDVLDIGHGPSQGPMGPFGRGAVVQVGCAVGYEGSQRIWELTCQGSDVWDSNQTDCRPLQCEVPSDPLGTWQGQRGYNHTLRLECVDGYVPDGGSPEFLCEEPGAFSLNLARCVPGVGNAQRWRTGLQTQALFGVLGATTIAIIVIGACWREPPPPSRARSQLEGDRLVDAELQRDQRE